MPALAAAELTSAMTGGTRPVVASRTECVDVGVSGVPLREFAGRHPGIGEQRQHECDIWTSEDVVHVPVGGDEVSGRPGPRLVVIGLILEVQIDGVAEPRHCRRLLLEVSVCGAL